MWTYENKEGVNNYILLRNGVPIGAVRGEDNAELICQVLNNFDAIKQDFNTLAMVGYSGIIQ